MIIFNFVVLFLLLSNKTNRQGHFSYQHLNLQTSR